VSLRDTLPSVTAVQLWAVATTVVTHLAPRYSACKAGRRCWSAQVVACELHVCRRHLPPSDTHSHPLMARMWHEAPPHARADRLPEFRRHPSPEESRRNPQAPHLRHIPDNYDHTAVRAYGWGYAKTKSPAGEWVRSNYGVGRGTGLGSPPAVALV